MKEFQVDIQVNFLIKLVKNQVTEYDHAVTDFFQMSVNLEKVPDGRANFLIPLRKFTRKLWKTEFRSKNLKVGKKARPVIFQVDFSSCKIQINFCVSDYRRSRIQGRRSTRYHPDVPVESSNSDRISNTESRESLGQNRESRFSITRIKNFGREKNGSQQSDEQIQASESSGKFMVFATVSISRLSKINIPTNQQSTEIISG